VAKAMAQIEALNQRGRGKKRFETVSAFRQAVVAIVQRYSVEDLIWFHLTQHNIPRPVRAYRGQPARSTTIAMPPSRFVWTKPL